MQASSIQDISIKANAAAVLQNFMEWEMNSLQSLHMSFSNRPIGVAMIDESPLGNVYEHGGSVEQRHDFPLFWHGRCKFVFIFESDSIIIGCVQQGEHCEDFASHNERMWNYAIKDCPCC